MDTAQELNRQEQPQTRADFSPQSDDATTSPNRVILYITRPEETKNCNFWIGLFKKGSIHPSALYDFKSIEEVYYRAVTEGLDDAEPLLISNTEKFPPEHFYFIPHETFIHSPERLIAQILDTLSAMNPIRAGLYFSPDLINKAECLNLLKQVLISCKNAPTREFYLFAGKHGINSVLNTAIDVKHELLNQIEVLVFH